MLCRESIPFAALAEARFRLMVHGSVMVGVTKNDPISAFTPVSLLMTSLDLLCSSPFLPKSYQPEIILRATDPEQILAPCSPPKGPLGISAHVGSSPGWLTLLAFAASDQAHSG